MKRDKILCVLPECYVDTNLVEYLLDAGVNHQHCCNKVVAQLNTRFVDKFAIGIIDRDKVRLGYIQDCEEIAQTEHLTLMKHRERPQYLILVAPAIDGFVLDCAKEQGVSPDDFGIPSELKGFTKLSKSVTANSDRRFRSLFIAIRDNREIRSLKSTLEYLCKNGYSSDCQLLKEIFVGNQIV